MNAAEIKKLEAKVAKLTKQLEGKSKKSKHQVPDFVLESTYNEETGIASISFNVGEMEDNGTSLKGTTNWLAPTGKPRSPNDHWLYFGESKFFMIAKFGEYLGKSK